MHLALIHQAQRLCSLKSLALCKLPALLLFRHSSCAFLLVFVGHLSNLTSSAELCCKPAEVSCLSQPVLFVAWTLVCWGVVGCQKQSSRGALYAVVCVARSVSTLRCVLSSPWQCFVHLHMLCLHRFGACFGPPWDAPCSNKPCYVSPTCHPNQCLLVALCLSSLRCFLEPWGGLHSATTHPCFTALNATAAAALFTMCPSCCCSHASVLGWHIRQ